MFKHNQDKAPAQGSRRRSKKRWIIVVLVVLVVALATVFSWLYFSKQGPFYQKPAPQPVETPKLPDIQSDPNAAYKTNQYYDALDRMDEEYNAKQKK